VQFDGEKPDKITRGACACNDDKVIFGRFPADLWSTPISWRKARFSSPREARDRKIEAKDARSVVRKMSIG
jgi:hypothetical protein